MLVVRLVRAKATADTATSIRSGGIVFLIAIVLAGFVYPNYLLAVAGAAVIGVVSLLHDYFSLSWKIRLSVYVAAVLMMFQFLPVFIIMPWWAIAVLCMFVLGCIQVYKSMDGINGMTVLYSLVVLGGLQYVNINVFNFVERDLIWLPMISCVVFLFFNFRKKAKCFAGNVGSVTMAFWIMFLLLRLILDSGNPIYILFLAVYGVDSVLTLVHSLILRQNIFGAHRLHFYQILANERRVPHLVVSSIYAIVQGLIVWLIIGVYVYWLIVLLICTLPLVGVYMLKFRLMK
ncbi:MraY family glycosyltransferase [Albibacterium indicum]|uniref:UDP-GlcNAc--UDP-phosphate GlcNAc-1-phosphate transferase n=1 Tax=Albibacterium indicum TaxID=2292082 RepID=UPI00130042DA|nr:UDP-GlcNAc--UDP-phosphate GlcNAc-1-phosphate transferase [Pedobacter indicus]